MLHLLDESMEAFLRAEVPLSVRDVDVVFEAPDGDWAAGVSRPTVNLYLWDVRPNLALRLLIQRRILKGEREPVSETLHEQQVVLSVRGRTFVAE